MHKYTCTNQITVQTLLEKNQVIPRCKKSYSQTCLIRKWVIIYSNPYITGLEQICLYFPNPDISNPNKDSPGTKKSGLTKFDCN